MFNIFLKSYSSSTTIIKLWRFLKLNLNVNIDHFTHFLRYYREGSQCERCDRSCELCKGAGPESCRACAPPLLELQGTKLCVEHCPHRFYQLNDMCKQCHTSCQTCTGIVLEATLQLFLWSICHPALDRADSSCRYLPDMSILHFCFHATSHVISMCFQMPRLRDVWRATGAAL